MHHHRWQRQICKDAAKDYGADYVIDYTDGDIYDQVMEITGGKPVDCVCVCGGTAEGSYTTAFRCVKPGERSAASSPSPRPTRSASRARSTPV
jgi:NADPH:quinone reductase-like Zn-dependent oxidoreductase